MIANIFSQFIKKLLGILEIKDGAGEEGVLFTGD